MGFTARGVGLRVQGLRFKGLEGILLEDMEFESNLGFRVQDLWFKVEASRIRGQA